MAEASKEHGLFHNKEEVLLEVALWSNDDTIFMSPPCYIWGVREWAAALQRVAVEVGWLEIARGELRQEKKRIFREFENVEESLLQSRNSREHIVRILETKEKE